MKNSGSKKSMENSGSMEGSNSMMGSKTGQVIAAAVIGAAAGAVAGILLAPSSGRETLDNMSRKANKLKNDLSDSVREYAHIGKDKVSEMTGSESTSKNKSSTASANGSSNSSNQTSSRASNTNI